MNIVEIESRTPELLARLLEVWEASVRATHLFLSPGGIEAVKVYGPQALREVPHLVTAEAAGFPVGFMGIDGRRLEMLFLSPEERGKGLGRKLTAVGLDSPEKLREAGARDAFFRLKTLYPNVCLVHLHALEGAIRDVDCNRLPEEVREDLRAFNDYLKGKGGPTP